MPNAKNQTTIILATLTLAILAIFAPSLSYPFVDYDDPHYVINNYALHDGLTPGAISWAFTTGYAENWHPLTWLSHMLDFQLYGMRPGAHRLTNIFLHILSTFALFAALRKLTGAVLRSAAVAALFAIHPLHVESVIWVAERKDVLSGLFFMLTLWAYAHFRDQPRPLPYLLLLTAFTLGLLAKSMLVTLPCVLLLLDYWPLNRFAESTRTFSNAATRFTVEKLPLFALSALFCVVTFLVQRAGGTMKTIDTIPLAARAANAVIAYGAYLGKTVLPINLAVLYPHPGTNIPWHWFALSLATLVAISSLAWKLRKSAPYVIIGWLWYLGTLVPVIGLVQVGDQAYADRYTYLPLIGIFIIAAWGATDLWKRFAPAVTPRAPLYATLLVIAALTATAAAQTRHWSSSTALFQRCVQVTPENASAWNNLGRARHEAGDIDGAVEAYTIALELAPHVAMPGNNLAIVLLEQADYTAAEQTLREALAIDPNDPRLHLNLGIALAAQDKTNEARAAMEKAVQLSPNLLPARFSLATLLIETGNPQQGIQHLEALLTLQPNHQQAKQLLMTITQADSP